MKTKRTISSVLVVISVFCLSIVFDIQYDSYTTKSQNAKNIETTSHPETTMETNISTSEFTVYTSDIRASYLTASQASELYIVPELSADTQEEDTSTLLASRESDSSSLKAEENKDLTENVTKATEIIEEEQVSPTDVPNEALKEATAEPSVKSRYRDIGISIAKSYVNIRESASTDSPVLGKLYKGAAAKVIKSEGEWYYVESGSVKGYLKTEFLKTGIADDELIEKYGIPSAKVKVDGLNVRTEPNAESQKLTVVYMNETYPVVEMQEEWLKLDIADDQKIGYVKREYVELLAAFKDAISKEEEKELQRLKEEERIKKETKIKHREEVSYTKDDLKLLAALVHAEAGNQSYEGKLAVANIVLNRIKSSKYPDTLKGVIYQPGQFTVATSGSLDKQLSNYGNYSSASQRLTIKAARAALEGANNIGSRLYFNSYESAVKKGYDKKANCVKVQDQLFW